MQTTKPGVAATAIVSVAALVGLGGGFLVAKVRHSVAAPTTTGAGAASTSPQLPQSASETPTGPSISRTSKPPPTSAQPNLAADLLYFAEGVIHDGPQRVTYTPQFQASVAAVSRTASGWLVFERSGQDSSRLVLVDASGSTIPLDAADPHSFDVAPRGDAIVVPADTGQIDVIDPADGSVLGTVTTPLEEVRQVRFAGNDAVIFDGGGAAGRLRVLRYDFASDRVSPVHLAKSAGEVTLEDVSFDGTYALVGALSGNRSCAAAFDLRGSAPRLWSSCRYAPSAGTSISPDGTRVAVLSAGGSSASAAGFTVLDVRTGAPLASVPASSPVGATWIDATHLLVESAVNNDYATFTLQTCTVPDGACTDVAGAQAPADDVAAGTTY